MVVVVVPLRFWGTKFAQQLLASNRKVEVEYEGRLAENGKKFDAGVKKFILGSGSAGAAVCHSLRLSGIE